MDLAELGLSCGIWDPVPQPGMEPEPLQWKWEVLTTGLPGISQESVLIEFKAQKTATRHENNSNKKLPTL